MSHSIAVMLGIMGGSVSLVGSMLVLANRKNLRARARVKATPTTAIDKAHGESIVEIKGRVVLSDAGAVTAPFSGRAVVWAEVTGEILVSSGRSSHWSPIFKEVVSCDFLVDDRSGERARVEPRGADVRIVTSHELGVNLFDSITPRIRTFLETHRSRDEIELLERERMRFVENVIFAGNPIYALGHSKRGSQATANVDAAYRSSGGSELVLYSTGPQAEHRLLLTNETEDRLLKTLYAPTRAGYISLAVGLVMIGIAVLLHAQGL